MPAKNIVIDTLTWEVEERAAGIHAARMLIIDAAGNVLGGTNALKVTIDPNSPGLLKDDEYETVAAAQTDQILGVTGAVGDYLGHLLVVPTTTSPGAVSIRDGAAGAVISVFAGGASSVSSLVPFPIPIRLRALSAGWRVTTGANLSVLAVGNFT